jgi:hypothetical protein
MGDAGMISDDVTNFVNVFTQGQSYIEQVQGQLHFKETDIAVLFERLYQRRMSILPFEAQKSGTKFDVWMIVGDERGALDAFMRAVSRFIVPSYAAFNNNIPQIHTFKPSSQLGEIGHKLFLGYYRLLSPRSHRPIILSQLRRCFSLLNEADAPPLIHLDTFPYRELYEAFQQSLLARQWDEAERILETIDANNLTTAENLNFLRIEWLARQEQWGKIWEHPHYKLLAQIPTPRPIRSALLIAFHYTQLVEPEQNEDWTQSLAVFQKNRPLLALLLNGRFGLTHSALLRIFAYLAVSDGDRAMFERTEADVPKHDYQTRFVLSQLQSYLPLEIAEDNRSISQKVQDALNISDYETAWQLTDILEHPLEKIAARIQISYLSQESTLVLETLKAYDRLYIENRRELNEFYPDVQGWLAEIMDRLGIEQQLIIQTWDEWFSIAQSDARHPALVSALDALPASTSETFWLREHIVKLTTYLAEVPNQHYLQHTVYRLAINQLVAICLDDEHFPRTREDIADLYEFLLQFLAQDERNERNTNFILRLQEANLVNQPSAWKEAATFFINWFGYPVPALQPGMLEALELLAFYGAQPANVFSWYREWAESVISVPQVDLPELEVWLSFGAWIQAGEDILRGLRKRVEALSNTYEDHLAQLPSGFQITIFSFDEAAANRARDILKNHNPQLDVRVCSERDNNKTVESLARNANLVVLVTSCISHAISYAVTPYAGERLVYPKSRGASSILKSIEEYLLGQS